MKKLLFLMCALLATRVCSQEIILRHSLNGAQLDTLATLTLRFNDEQHGKGKISLQATSIDGEAGALPHMALLDIVDSMRVFGTLPRLLPLHQLMRDTKQALDAARFFPQIADAVDDPNGRLQALPLALSFPVLYINRSLLTKSGVIDQTPPRSWLDLQQLAGELQAGGSTCPLTSSNFSWVHLENLSSQHGQAILPRPVGRGGPDTFWVNSLIHVKHLALLATWQQSHYFIYSGPGREGDARFLDGECAMLTGESSLFGEIRRRGINAAVAPLPYYDDMSEVRPNDVLPDGRSLWILAGFKRSDYPVISRFISFLLRPEVQREWVSGTSFLPMSPAASGSLRNAGGIPDAQKELLLKRLAAPKKVGERLRSGSTRERLRAILGEEVEFVWNGQHPSKQALDLAARRGGVAPSPAPSPAPSAKPATTR